MVRRALLLALGALLLSACGGGSAPAANAGSEIVIGASLSLTGPIAAPNQQYEHAVNAYVNSINQNGGINGHKLRLDILDDGYQGQRGIANMRQLVEQDKVNLILGGVGTAPAVAEMPYVTQSGIPFLFPYAGSNVIYSPARPNVFTVYPDFATVMKPVYPYFVSKVNPKKTGVVYLAQEGINQAAAGAQDYLKSKNIAVAAFIGYQLGSITDFTPIVQQLRNAGADSVIFISSTPDMARFAQAAKRAGWNVPIAGQQSAADDSLVTLGGADVEGIYAVTIQVVLGDTSVSGPAEAIVKQYYPEEAPSGYMLYGVGVARLVEQVLKDATDPTNGASIIKSASGLKNVDVKIFPPITFAGASDHLGLHSASVTQIQGGKVVRVSDWLSLS
jgi:branched-chain amino acid transport system substrate-binding protein